MAISMAWHPAIVLLELAFGFLCLCAGLLHFLCDLTQFDEGRCGFDQGV
jgi:hypothetical protein